MPSEAVLKSKVWRILGRLARGQSVSADDGAIFDEAYDGVYSELAEFGLVTWANGDSIPNEFYLPLATYIAYRLIDEAGSDQKKAELRTSGPESLMKIRAIRSKRHIPETTPFVDY